MCLIKIKSEFLFHTVDSPLYRIKPYRALICFILLFINSSACRDPQQSNWFPCGNRFSSISMKRIDWLNAESDTNAVILLADTVYLGLVSHKAKGFATINWHTQITCTHRSSSLKRCRPPTHLRRNDLKLIISPTRCVAVSFVVWLTVIKACVSSVDAEWKWGCNMCNNIMCMNFSSPFNA